MNPNLPQSLVLAVHPMARGLAWIAYDGVFSPWAWRTVRIKGYDNAAFIKTVTTLFDRLHPETLVLEAFDPTVSFRSPRIERLGRALVALARDRGIEVVVLRKADVQDCFSHVGATTRQEIAEAVARHTPQLERLLPAKRRVWDPENLRMALFSAAALVIAYYATDARQLLDDLRSRRSEASSSGPE